ncbi:MAG: VOC family protein [Myxococcota bacterium]
MKPAFQSVDHPRVTPSISVVGAAQCLEFICKVFGGEVVDRYDGPDGALLHSEVRVGDSLLMVSEPFGGTAFPGALYIYAPDVDAACAHAVKLGAKALDAPEDQFSGQRIGRVLDPWGNRWSIATQKEHVSREEVRRRFESWMKDQKR